MTATLHLYNTLTREKEPFVPLRANHVGLYACGPTVYGPIHIGNARPLIVFDVLYRLLKHRFQHVTYVRNITDVDDKIIAQAHDNEEPIQELTERTIEQFHCDLAALKCLRPDVEPRATEHVAEMIRLIETLLRQGVAYEAEGHVLFHVPAMPTYGRLSRRERDDQIAGARVEVAPYKRDPADFVLWKPAAEGEPGWDSPFGFGRPGWHIECSAMSAQYLGVPFDIHAGGVDLIFPHHENEIAQSCCAHGTTELARYWLHNGFVTVEGEKMAKSAGNFVTVAEALEELPGEVFRFWMLGAHYRQPLDYSASALRQARGGLERLYRSLAELDDVEAAANAPPPLEVLEGLADDLNTPRAIAGLHLLAGEANKASRERDRARLKRQLLEGGALLGLLDEPPRAWLQGGAEAEAGEIETLIAERDQARAARDFRRADEIRDVLRARGIILEDGPQGTTWRREG
ncbi:MAG: cysteine--tRNA ligase [Alphaproteobacteria bacterium]|nr:cysteine--tRNA ligase [Alphaproteobacteria bacterium]